jgi:hypothetical protein
MTWDDNPVDPLVNLERVVGRDKGPNGLRGVG